MSAWIQCSNPDCGKWRNLKNIFDLNDLPEIWFCTMNDDPESNSCDKPEEKQNNVVLSSGLRKIDLTYNGSLQNGAAGNGHSAYNYQSNNQQLISQLPVVNNRPLPPIPTIMQIHGGNFSQQRPLESSFTQSVPVIPQSSQLPPFPQYSYANSPSNNGRSVPPPQPELILTFPNGATPRTTASNGAFEQQKDFNGVKTEDNSGRQSETPPEVKRKRRKLADFKHRSEPKRKSTANGATTTIDGASATTAGVDGGAPSSKTAENAVTKQQLADRLLPCGVCGREFMAYPPNGGTLRIWKLREHVTLHFECSVWKCPLCDFESKNKQNIYLHLTKSRKHGDRGIGEKPELAVSWAEYVRRFRDMAPKCFPEQANMMNVQ